MNVRRRNVMLPSQIVPDTTQSARRRRARPCPTVFLNAPADGTLAAAKERFGTPAAGNSIKNYITCSLFGRPPWRPPRCSQSKHIEHRGDRHGFKLGELGERLGRLP